MRRAHYLKPLRGRSYPRTLIFADTESYREVTPRGEIHTLRLGCYEVWRRGRGATTPYALDDSGKFTTPDAWWDVVERSTRRGESTWVYAHNWNYDALVLALRTTCATRGWTIETYVNEHGCFVVRVRLVPDCAVTLVDTLNLFPVRLEVLGESIGVPKLPMPEDGAPESAWEVYCRRDVQVIRRAVFELIGMLRAHDWGSLRWTAASQAFSIFRTRYLRERVLVHDKEEVLALEREAYHGGRTEAYQLGKICEQVHVLDVNSMYPSVMVSHVYPVRLALAGTGVKVAVLQALLQRSCAIAEVTLLTHEPVYPLRRAGKLVFPIGRFTTVLTTRELEYALAHGHVLRIGRFAVYEAAPLFHGYVRTLYALRRKYEGEGNSAYAYFVKLLLNSLYGKFGQRSSRWQEVNVQPLPYASRWIDVYPERGESYEARSHFGKVEYRTEGGEAENSVPAIAAHVTADARMKLWTYMTCAGLANVYYVDTDSLVVNEAGFHRLTEHIHEAELGALKTEAVSDGIVIEALKHYSYGSVVKRKGIRRDAVKVGPASYRQMLWHGLDWHWDRGIDGRVVIDRMEKTLSLDYGKGHVVDGRVRPFTLDELGGDV